MATESKNLTDIPTDIFEGVHEIRISKVVGIFISVINITFLSPAIYFMIWYEKFESNRSLVNQFVSSSCWTAFIFNFFVQTGVDFINILRTAFTPIDPESVKRN